MNPGFETATDNHWNLLQQPSRSTHVSSPYLLLMAALDQGWQVSGPVQRTTIHHVDEPCAYRFVLQHADNRDWYTLHVPAGEEIERFLSQEEVWVEVSVLTDC